VFATRPNQNIGGNAEALVQPSNHSDRQSAPALERIGFTSAGTFHLFHIDVCELRIGHPSQHSLT
jgi:hypothetical protein